MLEKSGDRAELKLGSTLKNELLKESPLTQHPVRWSLSVGKLPCKHGGWSSIPRIHRKSQEHGVVYTPAVPVEAKTGVLLDPLALA